MPFNTIQTINSQNNKIKEKKEEEKGYKYIIHMITENKEIFEDLIDYCKKIAEIDETFISKVLNPYNETQVIQIEGSLSKNHAIKRAKWLVFKMNNKIKRAVSYKIHEIREISKFNIIRRNGI